jgi:hypothetical protein
MVKLEVSECGFANRILLRRLLSFAGTGWLSTIQFTICVIPVSFLQVFFIFCPLNLDNGLLNQAQYVITALNEV